jgi:hypothetical protein
MKMLENDAVSPALRENRNCSAIDVLAPGPVSEPIGYPKLAGPKLVEPNEVDTPYDAPSRSVRTWAPSMKAL